MNKFDLFIKKIKDNVNDFDNIVLKELKDNQKNKVFSDNLNNDLKMNTITKDGINFTIVSYKEKICDTKKIDISNPDSFESNEVFKTYLMIDNNEQVIDNLLIKRTQNKNESLEYFDLLKKNIEENNINNIFTMIENKMINN